MVHPSPPRQRIRRTQKCGVTDIVPHIRAEAAPLPSGATEYSHLLDTRRYQLASVSCGVAQGIAFGRLIALRHELFRTVATAGRTLELEDIRHGTAMPALPGQRRNRVPPRIGARSARQGVKCRRLTDPGIQGAHQLGPNRLGASAG